VLILFDWTAASICVELGDIDNRSGWHWSEASLNPCGDFWEMMGDWIMSNAGGVVGRCSRFANRDRRALGRY
jgi:hypothetical protein